MGEQINVDYMASQYAQKIVKKVEKKDMKALETLTTKTLAVLQEQGVYAMALFLLSRKDEESISRTIREFLCNMLEEIPTFNYENKCKNEEILEYYSSVTNDLDLLLLIRSIYVKTLIYTRYGAKAARIEDDSRGGKQ